MELVNLHNSELLSLPVDADQRQSAYQNISENTSTPYEYCKQGQYHKMNQPCRASKKRHLYYHMGK